MQLGEHRWSHSETSRSLGWLAALRVRKGSSHSPHSVPEPGVQCSELWQPQGAFPRPLFYHILYWSQEQLLDEKTKDKFRQLSQVGISEHLTLCAGELAALSWLLEMDSSVRL